MIDTLSLCAHFSHIGWTLLLLSKEQKRTIETTVSLKCCQAVKIGLGFLAMHLVVIPVGLGKL
jgi:hypothetical protein